MRYQPCKCWMCSGEPAPAPKWHDVVRVLGIVVVAFLAVASLSVKSCDWEPLEPSNVGLEAP